ncbi:hypothetical protein GS396_10710 [Stenotrophomonas maltophilia]|nr:hypothetical protein GS396_10710 [Stenotrophomonas maltophilia]
MNIFRKIKRTGNAQPSRRHITTLLLGTALLLGTGGASAQAVEKTITAIFTPSILDPTNNRFVNTTPKEGYCPGCDVAILIGVGGNFKDINIDAEPRRSVYIKIPSEKRQILVSHEDGASTALVEWRATAFSSKLNANGVLNNFDSAWLYARGGCGNSGLIRGHAHQVEFRWLFREAAVNGCYKIAASRDFPDIRASMMAIGYELKTPNPLGMKSGIYRGSISLSVGPGGDFDFGDNFIATASEITLKFELTVKHSFKVEFPSYHPTVSLNPVGGWHQWTDYGRAPSRLQQELPFALTSSSDFSVKMRCEHESEGRCGIKDQSAGTIAPVDVDVTMPGMRDLTSGAYAVNAPLIAEHSGSTAPRFRPDGYLENRPSKIRFSASGSSLDEMLKAPGSSWQGDVTVIFDSDP